ncbi:MAG: winged helix-turn-helix transcriptional regulator [Myxococcales bacterium]
MRFNTTMCPRLQAALEILGKRWTGLVVQALLEGPQRFSELAKTLEVVSERMLAARLKELEGEGIVLRRAQSGSPHVQYELTEKGRALGEVLGAVGRWATAWVKPVPRTRARA